MTLGTTVPITMTHGIMVGLGTTDTITVHGTGELHGGITTTTGAGAEEAGMADTGDIDPCATEVDMLLPLTMVAEADGQAATMLADVHIGDLLLMVRQAMAAEAGISIAEQVA